MGELYLHKYSQLDDIEKRYIREIDGVLDRSEIRENIEVVRLSDAQLIFGKGKASYEDEFSAHKGEIISCKSFLSSSAASSGLSIVDSNKDVEYRIRIKAGTVGAGMYIGDKRINGWGNRQREFLLNRNSYFKVGDSKYDSTGKKYIVNLDYVGHGEHDYS